MTKKVLFISAVCLFAVSVIIQPSSAKGPVKINAAKTFLIDTIPPTELMDIIKTVVYATDKFNINAVADLYTPNAVVADNEPPYSWNGPTAGIQWINAVEKACKDIHLTKFKATLDEVSYYQHNENNAYVIVPVSYSGNLPGKKDYSAQGAFTFVFRLANGKWLIKSQAWMPKK